MRSLIRFGITGALATATHVVVFVLLVEWLHLRPVWAAAPAFLAAVGVSYGLNYRWTFAAEGPHRVMAPRFMLVALAGLALNLGITWLIVDLALLWYGYALMTVIAVVPLLTYLLSRFWVFSRP